MDYSNIIGLALLLISELLPFFSKIPANGILHTIKIIIAYAFVKCFADSDLAKEVEQLKDTPSSVNMALSSMDV